MVDVILSRNSDFEKVLVYTIDNLERKDQVVISATIDQAKRLQDLLDVLCGTIGYSVKEKTTGHRKVCGKHMKTIRCTILANKVEFSKEFNHNKR